MVSLLTKCGPVIFIHLLETYCGVQTAVAVFCCLLSNSEGFSTALKRDYQPQGGIWLLDGDHDLYKHQQQAFGFFK